MVFKSLCSHKSFFVHTIYSIGNVTETETETKVFATELLQTVYASVKNSNNSGSTSNIQSNGFVNYSIRNHCEQQSENTCEICSHEFCTIEELSAHRQQGCERLIDFDSNIMECNPTVADFTNYDIDPGLDETHATDYEFDVDTPSKYSECVAVRIDHQSNDLNTFRLDPADIDKKPSNTTNNKNNATEQSDRKVSNKQHTCEMCNRIFSSASNLKKHQHIHSDQRPFKCPLCNKS